MKNVRRPSLTSLNEKRSIRSHAGVSNDPREAFGASFRPLLSNMRDWLSWLRGSRRVHRLLPKKEGEEAREKHRQELKKGRTREWRSLLHIWVAFCMRRLVKKETKRNICRGQVRQRAQTCTFSQRRRHSDSLRDSLTLFRDDDENRSSFYSETFRLFSLHHHHLYTLVRESGNRRSHSLFSLFCTQKRFCHKESHKSLSHFSFVVSLCVSTVQTLNTCTCECIWETALVAKFPCCCLCLWSMHEYFCEHEEEPGITCLHPGHQFWGSLLHPKQKSNVTMISVRDFVRIKSRIDDCNYTVFTAKALHIQGKYVCICSRRDEQSHV